MSESNWYRKHPGKWHYTVTQQRVVLTNVLQELYILDNEIKSIEAVSQRGNILFDVRRDSIYIEPGYSWNGADKFFDFESTMLASCVHDALIQLGRYIPISSNIEIAATDVDFKLIDDLFLDIMRRERFWLRWPYYTAVRVYDRLFGHKPYTQEEKPFKYILVTFQDGTKVRA